MSARYEVRGNTYPVKDKIKLAGFFWNPKTKVWARGDAMYDVWGDITADAVAKLQEALEEEQVNVEIVYIDENGKEAPL